VKTAALDVAWAMTTLERVVDIVANNLANASTPAFKRIVVKVTGGVPIPVAVSDGAAMGIGTLAGLPVSLTSGTDAAQGPVQRTGNPLDVAISGPGFFVVQTKAGAAYTRDGHFEVDAQGRLVTGAGDPVLGTAGPIVIPQGARSVEIGRDGTVAADGAVIGQLRIELPPGQLQPLGGGLYAAAGPGRPVAPPLTPGALEGSNVSPVREMVALIAALRAYESAQRVMQEEDGIQRLAAQSVGATP
jgi:flagellar basal-body rod protein FlgF